MEEFLDNEYYEIENMQLGFDVTAYVENEEDVSFWGSLFYKFAPKIKVNFEYNSRGNLTRGKGEVLKSKNLLGPSFILCIDSDLDYLLQKDYLNPAKNPKSIFILQTYTYSIENHKCNPNNLNQLCKEATMSEEMPKDFDFVKFAESYSKICYDLLLYIIYFNTKGVPPKIIQRRGIGKILSIPNKQNISLKNNGAEILNRTKNKVGYIKKTLARQCDSEELKAIEKRLKNDFNIYPQNAYLYIIGHILYDNFARIVMLVVSQLFANKIDSFIKTAEKHTNDKKESQRLKHKISEYKNLTRNMHIKTLMATNHLKCLAYGNCIYMDKIGQDIYKFLSLRNK